MIHNLMNYGSGSACRLKFQFKENQNHDIVDYLTTLPQNIANNYLKYIQVLESDINQPMYVLVLKSVYWRRATVHYAMQGQCSL